MTSLTREALREALLAELEEGIDAARARERSAFARLRGPADGAIVLLGAGGLGRKALAGLRAVGIEVAAFADNNLGGQGRSVEGLEVLRPADAIARFGADTTYVVAIWGAGSRHWLPDSEAQLRALGARYVVPAAPLFWSSPDTFLPHFAMDLPSRAIAGRDAILAAFDALADEASCREFLAQLRWRTRLDYSTLTPGDESTEYFCDELFARHDEEVYVDGGAYDGDTIRTFLRRYAGAFGRIHAVEPDATSFARLTSYVASLPDELRARVRRHAVAITAEAGPVSFAALGSLSSAVTTDGAAQVAGVPLDALLPDERPTLIKMDLEGGELDALAGARETIRRAAPVLTICAYHRQDHLWRVPLTLRELAPDASIHLRSHGSEVWDLVCYAVPPDRRPR